MLVVTHGLRTFCTRRMRARTDIREAAVEVVITASWIGAGDGSSSAGWSAFSGVFLVAGGIVAVQFGAHPIGGMAVRFCAIERLRAIESVVRAVDVGVVG